ncbi:MAG: amidase [Alphaproteobacteria bacterium]|nr:amidase [Alphaproteobacteria bacterium]
MEPFPEYENYDALGLAELVRNGEVTAAELLDAAIARAEMRNPTVNAIVDKLYDHGRDTVAAGLPDGPFTGVPYLLKDIGGVLGGYVQTRGSRFFDDLVPPEDSVIVKRGKRAGLVIFGKTNTPELGLSLTCEPQLFGPSRNPWDLERTPGGSSGGSSAAVAAYIVPMASGGDGFGSIRAPASCCGLVGLKPTRARNTQDPYSGEGNAGQTTEHALTRSVRDSAALLDATAGPGSGDPYVAPPPARPFLDEVGADPGRLCIAMTSRAPNGAPVESEVLDVFENAAKLLRDLGHDVEEADPDIDRESVIPTFRTISAANVAAALRSHPAGKKAGPSNVERVTAAAAKLGEEMSGADYVQATQAAHRLGRRMAAFHQSYDVLLTPALGTLPPRLGWIDMMLEDADEYWNRVFSFSPFTVWFNITGQPGITLPMGVGETGLPISVQLVAPYGDEATLIRLAAQLETARPWTDRRPEVVGD